MAGDFIPTRAEAARSLAGLFYLMVKRPEGLRLFDVSPDGFWRSFGAFAWSWPVQCFLWTGLWRADPASRPEGAGGMLRFFAQVTGFDALAWIVPALLLLAATRLFGISGKFARLVVVNNWFGLMSAYIGFFPAALRYLAPLPDGVNVLLTLAVYAVVIGLYYRIIRICLDGDAMLAVFITGMMVMTGLTISELAFSALAG